jgi:hypothetical protein
LKVQGLVKNVSTRSLARIQVHVVLRDETGRFLGVDSCYAPGQSLAPGDSIPWSLTTPEPAGFHRADIAAISWDWAPDNE